MLLFHHIGKIRGSHFEMFQENVNDNKFNGFSESKMLILKMIVHFYAKKKFSVIQSFLCFCVFMDFFPYRTCLRFFYSDKSFY